MKKSLAACLFFVLAACAEPSIYDAGSYQKLTWAKQSFDETMSRCRYDSGRMDRRYDRYVIQRPAYKSCMDRRGYRYIGDSEVVDNDVPFPIHSTAPVQPVVNSAPVAITPPPEVKADKSALYH